MPRFRARDGRHVCVASPAGGKVLLSEDKAFAKSLIREDAMEDVTVKLLKGTGLCPFSTSFGGGLWPAIEE